MPLEDQCSALSYVSNLQSLMQRASSKYTLLRIAGSIANDEFKSLPVSSIQTFSDVIHDITKDENFLYKFDQSKTY